MSSGNKGCEGEEMRGRLRSLAASRTFFLPIVSRRITFTVNERSGAKKGSGCAVKSDK